MKRKALTIIFTLIIASMLLAGCNQDTSQLASSITQVVPNVVGLTEDEAKSKISNAGFAPEVVLVESDKVPAGAVVSTDPAAGEAAEPSATVKLFVSKGEESSAAVPDVVGMSLDEATKALTSQGLQVGDVKYKDSAKAKDTVLLSDPLPGVSVESGSKVGLTLSAGSKREHTLSVEVDVPESSEDIEFTVYIDGKLNSSYTKTVDPSTPAVTFEFKGSGKKNVKIKADGQAYKSYELDFDKETVKEI